VRGVFAHRDLAAVDLRRGILEQAGITCFVRNETTSASLGAAAMGLVFMPQFHPELCVVDDARVDEAKALLGSLDAGTPSPGAEWACPTCGEVLPPEFDTCWKCPPPTGD
jgi:Putative prokaryotic signal transducing protein